MKNVQFWLTDTFPLCPTDGNIDSLKQNHRVKPGKTNLETFVQIILNIQ